MEAETLTTSCPRCNYDSVERSGSHTIRHAYVIDIDEFDCPVCGLYFEQRE